MYRVANVSCIIQGERELPLLNGCAHIVRSMYKGSSINDVMRKGGRGGGSQKLTKSVFYLL